MRVLEVDGPSLVLGSSQSPDLVDAERAAAAGVAVTRRRSGGGAVYVAAGRQVWVDLLVPRGDRLWDDDVVRAAGWAGRIWAAAAASFTDQPMAVHEGGAVADRWGRLICFAGLGPAEVSAGGRKIVGVSQRRSRGWIRIQTMARIAPGGRPDPSGGRDEATLLALSEEDRSRARAAAAARSAALDADSGPVVEALLSLLI